MSFRQLYPELAKLEYGQIVYGCSICLALSFLTAEESREHCLIENKGKSHNSYWRHESVLKHLPLTGPIPVKERPIIRFGK